jgi:hypothetical protein
VLAYTTNGSAAPIQLWPNTIAPAIKITNQASAQRRSTSSVVRGQPGQWVPTDIMEPRLAPREDQDRERDHQRQHGADHDEGERQRQVAPRRNPMQWYQQAGE